MNFDPVTRSRLLHPDNRPRTQTRLLIEDLEELEARYVHGNQGPCAKCLRKKPLPYRRDDLGGYVCLACVEKYLDLLIDKCRDLEMALEKK